MMPLTQAPRQRRIGSGTRGLDGENPVANLTLEGQGPAFRTNTDVQRRDCIRTRPCSRAWHSRICVNRGKPHPTGSRTRSHQTFRHYGDDDADCKYEILMRQQFAKAASLRLTRYSSQTQEHGQMYLAGNHHVPRAGAIDPHQLHDAVCVPYRSQRPRQSDPSDAVGTSETSQS